MQNDNEWSRHDYAVALGIEAISDNINTSVFHFSVPFLVRRWIMSRRVSVVRGSETTDGQGALRERTVQVEEQLKPLPYGWNSLTNEDSVELEMVARRIIGTHVDLTRIEDNRSIVNADAESGGMLTEVRLAASMRNKIERGPTSMDVAYAGQVILLRAFGFCQELTLSDLLSIKGGDELCVSVAYDPYAMPKNYAGQPVCTPPGAVVLHLSFVDDIIIDNCSRGGAAKSVALTQENGKMVVYTPPQQQQPSLLGSLFGTFTAMLSSSSSSASSAKAAAAIPTDRYSSPNTILGWASVAAEHANDVNVAAFHCAKVLFPSDDDTPLEQRVVCASPGKYTISTFGIKGRIDIPQMISLANVKGFVGVGYHPRIAPRTPSPAFVSSPAKRFSVGGGGGPPMTRSSPTPPPAPGAIVVTVKSTTYAGRDICEVPPAAATNRKRRASFSFAGDEETAAATQHASAAPGTDQSGVEVKRTF